MPLPVSRTEGTTSTAYTYDRTDQLVKQASGGTDTLFTYDVFGNMTAKAVSAGNQTIMAYADGGRMTALTPSGGPAVALRYDGLGRTATRTASGVTEAYAFAGTGETVVSITAGGATRSSIIDAAGSRLSFTSGGTTRWTITDLLGSTACLVAADGSIAEAYRYDGYGLPMGAQASITNGNPFRFRGAINLGTDADPLYEMGARLYAPSMGGWTQADSFAGSAADPASMNRFAYVEGNPTSLIDPTGHYAMGQVCDSRGDPCTKPNYQSAGHQTHILYPLILPTVPVSPTAPKVVCYFSGSGAGRCYGASSAQIERNGVAFVNGASEGAAFGLVILLATAACVVATGGVCSALAELLLAVGVGASVQAVGNHVASGTPVTEEEVYRLVGNIVGGGVTMTAGAAVGKGAYRAANPSTEAFIVRANESTFDADGLVARTVDAEGLYTKDAYRAGSTTTGSGIPESTRMLAKALGVSPEELNAVRTANVSPAMGGAPLTKQQWQLYYRSMGMPDPFAGGATPGLTGSAHADIGPVKPANGQLDFGFAGGGTYTRPIVAALPDTYGRLGGAVQYPLLGNQMFIWGTPDHFAGMPGPLIAWP